MTRKVLKNTFWFASRMEKAICCICLIVLFTSPLAPLFASEESALDVPSASDTSEEVSVASQTNEEVTQNSPTEEGSESGIDSIENPAISETEVISESNSNEETSTDESENPTIDTDTSSSPDTVRVEEDSDNTSETQPLTNENVTDSTDTETVMPDGVSEGATSTSETSETESLNETEEILELEDDLSTTTQDDHDPDEEDVDEEVQTDELPLPNPELATVYVDNDNSKYKFAENECVVTGGDSNTGTFFCTKSQEGISVTPTDTVYATKDSEGDKEIYVDKDGKSTALTSNAIEDDAPLYDEVSQTIVWHRLVDNRYQIISYDLNEEKETQLTFDRYNNMQPSRYAEATVWQGWVGDDWDIFMLVNDELTMITDNATQDIDPSINGSHVVWQAFEGNSWKMKVYDIHTKRIETIEDAEGGSIENPRFVLVYDTKFESGDVETRGYDIKSGQVVPLSATPAPLPEEIPDPDQTGEERALVTNPTQPKAKVEGEGDLDPLDDGDVPPPDAGDLVITPLSTSTATTTLDEYHNEDITDSENDVDLIILPLDTHASSSVSHIEDVIVTPYVEPIIETVDPQDAIAPIE